MGGVNYWFLRGLFFIILANVTNEIISSFVKKSIFIDLAYYVIMYILMVEASKLLPNRLTSFVGLSYVCNVNYLAFCFGTLCKKYDFITRIMERQTSFTLSMLCFIVLFMGSMKGYNDHLHWFIPSLLIPMSAIVCCWHLFRFAFVNGKVVEWFQFVGRHSLEIYLLHFLFAIKMPMVGEWICQYVALNNWRTDATASCLQLIHAIIISIVICFLCILTFKVLRYSPLLSYVLFGRKVTKASSNQ